MSLDNFNDDRRPSPPSRRMNSTDRYPTGSPSVPPVSQRAPGSAGNIPPRPSGIPPRTPGGVPTRPGVPQTRPGVPQTRPGVPQSRPDMPQRPGVPQRPGMPPTGLGLTESRPTSSSRPSASAKSSARGSSTSAKGGGGNGGNGGGGGNRTRNTKGRRRQPKRWLKVFYACLIAFAIFAGIGVGYVAWVLRDLPDWDAAHLANAKTTFLYDASGELYNELHGVENRTPVSLTAMPPYLIDCFIGAEDTRFYKHGGVDVRRVFGALIADIRSGGFSQGASTLTMQLARNAILEDQTKKLERKIKEAVIAVQLEREYSKDEIIEMYLNEIYFGHGAYGVEAASRHYFNKSVSDITLSEAAVLTGIVRNPKIYSPINDIEKSKEVRDRVLKSLGEYKPEYATQVAEAKSEEIVVNQGKNTKEYNYPWYTDYVIDEAEDILESIDLDPASVYTGGYKIYTSMDPTVQGLIDEGFADSDNFPSSRSADKVESAMVILSVDNSSILGLSGGREHTAKRGFNRATNMKRQPGSAFKPIGVFAPAIENGMSPASVANDVSTTFGTNYTPGNYDGSFSGVVTMREAARKSMNIPAVKFLQMISPEAGIEIANKLGMNLDPKVDANLSMSLGGLTYGITPLQMAAAYGAFGNGGIYTPPHAIDKIEDATGKVLYEAKPSQTAAIKDTTAYMVTSMLETVTQSGTGTNARLNRPVASKTGTVQLPDTKEFKGLKGNKDAWFAAYTPEMVGVVWMGYDSDFDSNGDAQYLRQIYGGKYPAQLWKSVVGGASKGLPVKQFTRPGDIVSVSIDKKSGLRPSEHTPSQFIGSEIFDRNNVPKEVSDVWQTVNVCTDSGQVATDFCLNTEKRQRFTPPKEKNKINGSGADRQWILNPKVCTMHTQNQGNVAAVSLCTDPAHNGKNVLANVATLGYTGGCPSNLVVKKNFSVNNLPTDYCGIADHQLVGNGDPTGGNGNGGTVTPPNPDTPQNSLKTPTGLSGKLSTTNNNTHVTLTWADSNSGSILYEIEYGTGESKNTVTTYFKDVTVANMKSGSTYTFRIRAIDDNAPTNTSGWSGKISISVP